MKVTTACAGRFHFFDQARELYRRGMLHKLVTAYPKFMARRWGLPDDAIVSTPHRAALNLAVLRMSRFVRQETHSRWLERTHAGFAKMLASVVPMGTEVLISHSSFVLEAVDWAKRQGITAVVDHGSLHQRTERTLLQRECKEFGFRAFGNWQHDWLLEREDQEFRTADFVLVCSNLAKKTLVEHGVLSSKVFVNQLGADISMFGPDQKKDSIFRILFVGGVSPLKGIHYLVRAFHELALPGAELWVVGSRCEDPVLERTIQRYTGANLVMKGVFAQPDLRDLYCQGTVFVLPSLADGWGMVVIQAMACGLPVIVSDMAGSSEAVVNGKNGFVVPARSVEALKEKLLFLYDNPEICHEMGRNALESVKREYSWRDYGDRLAHFLETSVKNSRMSANIPQGTHWFGGPQC